MKLPSRVGPVEMWLGMVGGALFGMIIPIEGPEKIPAVGIFCLLGAIAGLAGAKVRARIGASTTGLVSDPLPEGVVDQKTFLLNTLAEGRVAFREVTIHSIAAEKFLDAAEQEFAEGAFAPFWDQIERSANELAAYKNAIEQLGRCVHVYQAEALLLQNTLDAVPILHLPDHKLPDARPLVDRFSVLVRRAQTNFQFAMIFEQRKTNQLLHAGFGTLGAAIYSLGESVNLSLSQLSKTMNRGLANLLATSYAQADFARELKDARKDSAEVLDRARAAGRLDG